MLLLLLLLLLLLSVFIQRATFLEILEVTPVTQNSEICWSKNVTG